MHGCGRPCKRGFFACAEEFGIDVIGDYLTEINVTSPTGARALKGFTGVDATEIMWTRIEALRQQRG